MPNLEAFFFELFRATPLLTCGFRSADFYSSGFGPARVDIPLPALVHLYPCRLSLP